MFSSHQDAPGSEDREMLAHLAASAHNSQSGDDEAAIEKYLRSVLSLENILTLDRLRQVNGKPVNNVHSLEQCPTLQRLRMFKILAHTASLLKLIWVTFFYKLNEYPACVVGGGSERATGQQRTQQQTEPEFPFCPQGKTQIPHMMTVCKL